MDKAVEYEKRLTLFLDFLGFSEKVKATEKNAERLIDLVDALKDAAETANIGSAPDFQATQFSDCLVISYKFESPDALFDIVNKLSLIVVSLASRGYLIRGGLTYGWLLHTDEIVVGPAMIRAHSLESKVAKAPRVILDPEIFNAALKKPKDEVLIVIKKFLKRDKDKDGNVIWFFDYFSWQTVVATVGGENDLFPKYFKTLSGLIKAGLKSNDPGVLEKYVWMQRQYKIARDSLLSTPSNNPFRKYHPGYLESIEKLPPLRRAAARAKELIAEARKKENEKKK
ncbi:hypothetical protein [Pseudomonas syringae]|uniref:hypothetical protein n=1 Tax=Pseudomonas syringae TaxID=317 RepID=UPI001F16FC5F|nr:hypothetical protein [Pseudomonas syringae]MCF9004244.1 hypothetical protein [Pseudomonas syringae]